MCFVNDKMFYFKSSITNFGFYIIIIIMVIKQSKMI